MSEISPLQICHIKWLMREDADSLVVSTCNDNGSCLQVWELREKAIPIHKLFAGSEPKFFNTVVSVDTQRTLCYTYLPIVFYFLKINQIFFGLRCGNIKLISNIIIKLHLSQRAN